MCFAMLLVSFSEKNFLSYESESKTKLEPQARSFCEAESIEMKTSDQEAYVESRETYTKLFENVGKYRAIMSALAQAMFNEMKNDQV